MTATPPHPLHAALLARWARAPRPAEPLLRELLEQALAGRGEVLRLSPRRLVLRLPAADEAGWLLKLDAPRRALESVRRALRAGPAVRELRNAQRLGAEISAYPRQVAGEDLGAGRSAFARPWLQGRIAQEVFVDEALAIGAGFARLHAAGWTDPDLKAADLLLPPGGVLLPLDLGHARVQRRGATSSARRAADWERLLASVPRTRARAALPGLAEGYAQLAPLPAKAVELARAADALRCLLLRRHSRRCLRDCSDFAAEGSDRRRRRQPAGRIVAWQRGGAAAARELFRALYELELHGLRAARPLDCNGAGEVRAILPAEAVMGAADDEALLELGSDFARAGFGLALDAPAHFAADAHGRAWLADPRALLGPLRAAP